MRISHGIQIALVAIAVASCGGSGYDGPTAPGGGGSTGAVGATITIRANGTVSPTEVNIQVGQRVRFVNEDTRQHNPTSNPHLSHTDCPAANLPVMNAGQSTNSGVFDQIRVCGFHDHMNPDTESLRGTIRVGNAGGPPGPVYVRP